MEQPDIVTGIHDERLEADLHSRLEEHGYQCRSGRDQGQLLDLLHRANLPVLFISTTFDQKDLLSCIQLICEEVPTVSITALLEEEETDRIPDLIDAGINDFLIRPIEENEVPHRAYRATKRARDKQEEEKYNTVLEKRVNQRTRQLWENIRDIRQQFINTVHALCQALYAKHPYTEGHSWRVAKVSERIAYAMDLPEDEKEDIRVGALFHDIGKIGIRDRILDKPGTLTDEEYAKVKEHPIIAEEILSPMEEFSDIVDIIKYEHENFDGTGYPYGVSGEEIPLGARIVRVADTYDAIVTTRSYQERESHKDALNEIREASGSHFCPETTKHFLALFPEEEGGLSDSERKELLGSRYETVQSITREGFESDDDYFRDLKEDPDEDVIVIGGHPS